MVFGIDLHTSALVMTEVTSRAEKSRFLVPRRGGLVRVTCDGDLYPLCREANGGEQRAMSRLTDQTKNQARTGRSTWKVCRLAVIVLLTWAMLAGIPPAAAAQQANGQQAADVDAILAALQSSVDLNCSGDPRPSTNAAEQSYAERCGQEYDSQSGFHRCEWTEPGWVCSGPGLSLIHI